MKLGVPGVVTSATNLTIACFAPPSFHEGSDSTCAMAGTQARRIRAAMNTARLRCAKRALRKGTDRVMVETSRLGSGYDRAEVVGDGARNAVVEIFRGARRRPAVVVAELSQLDGKPVRQLERQGDVERCPEARCVGDTRIHEQRGIEVELRVAELEYSPVAAEHALKAPLAVAASGGPLLLKDQPGNARQVCIGCLVQPPPESRAEHDTPINSEVLVALERAQQSPEIGPRSKKVDARGDRGLIRIVVARRVR